MAINYSTVITKDELELMNPEDYKNIRLICEANVKRKHDRAFDVVCVNDNQQIKAYDFAFRNSDFANDPYCKKILIAANLLYFNNDTIINILLSKGITYKTLAATINRMSRIKELALIKDEYELDERTTISDKNLNTICKIIKKYYSYDDYNLIIAKLVELVVFEKELYLSLEGGPQKKHTIR